MPYSRPKNASRINSLGRRARHSFLWEIDGLVVVLFGVTLAIGKSGQEMRYFFWTLTAFWVLRLIGYCANGGFWWKRLRVAPNLNKFVFAFNVFATVFFLNYIYGKNLDPIVFLLLVFFPVISISTFLAYLNLEKANPSK